MRDSLRDSGDFNLLMTMRPDTAPAGSGAKKSIARLPSQPDDKFVVTVGASTRVSPMVRKVIRLKKDSVEDLYWKTAVRYDLREQQDEAMEQAHAIMGSVMMAALSTSKQWTRGEIAAMWCGPTKDDETPSRGMLARTPTMNGSSAARTASASRYRLEGTTGS